MRRDHGSFGLESMLVVALVALVAWMAVPRVLDARNTANELAAIRTLLTIAGAQHKCQAMRAIDVDNNGIGEFGFFGELSGAVNVRGSRVRVSPPLLSDAFASVMASMVLNSGYIFQMHLPDASGRGVPEVPSGGDPFNSQRVDPRMAAKLWCCYAWPASWSVTGTAAFFVNQSGRILVTKNRGHFAYNATVIVPVASAAFIASSSGTMDCRTAAGTVGIDGNRWTLIN